MGWYEVWFACDLKQDTPQQIIDTLTYMTRTEDYAFDAPPDHAYFESDYWRQALQTEELNASFPGEFRSVLRKVENSYFANSHISSRYTEYRYTLSVRQCIKDEEFGNDCWWNVLSWLAIHSETEGFIGYMRDEYSLMPSLLFFKQGIAYVQNEEGRMEAFIEGAPDW